MAEFLRRATPSRSQAGEKRTNQVCDLMRGYPALTEFLTLDVWGPDEVRETGTVLVCWDGERWKMWLNDRDSGRSAWLTGETLTALLVSAEDGLRSACVEWRGAQKGKPKGKGR